MRGCVPRLEPPPRSFAWHCSPPPPEERKDASRQSKGVGNRGSSPALGCQVPRRQHCHAKGLGRWAGARTQVGSGRGEEEAGTCGSRRYLKQPSGLQWSQGEGEGGRLLFACFHFNAGRERAGRPVGLPRRSRAPVAACRETGGGGRAVVGASPDWLRMSSAAGPGNEAPIRSRLALAVLLKGRPWQPQD